MKNMAYWKRKNALPGISHESDKNMPDGRAKSSPFQKNGDNLSKAMLDAAIIGGGMTSKGVKKNGDNDLKKNKKGFPSETKKPRNYEKEAMVGDIGDQIDFLNEDYHNHGKMSKAQYDAKMKILRAKEKAAIEANKLR